MIDGNPYFPPVTQVDPLIASAVLDEARNVTWWPVY